MTREIQQSTIDALDDEVVYPFFAVEMLFDEVPAVYDAAGVLISAADNALRLWTGLGTLVYAGVNWYGTGNLLNLDAIEETAEISAKGALVTLSGVPSEVLSLALSEPYQGRRASIYFGTFSKGLIKQEDGTSFILLEDGSKIYLELSQTGLTEIFIGYMDKMDIEETGETSTIQLSIENKLVDLERARIARYTSAYQKSIYPLDKGLDFIEDLQDKEIVWGRSSGN